MCKDGEVSWLWTTYPRTTGCCRMTSPSRIYLPAAPRGAKVVPVQRVPPSCTIRGQSHHNPIWAFWRQQLMPNISNHNLYSQLNHLKRHFNPVITLQLSLHANKHKGKHILLRTQKAQDNETQSLPPSHFIQNAYHLPSKVRICLF